MLTLFPAQSSERKNTKGEKNVQKDLKALYWQVQEQAKWFKISRT